MTQRMPGLFPRAAKFLFAAFIAIATTTPPLTSAQSSATTAVYEGTDVAGDWQGTLEFPDRNGQSSRRFRIVLRIARSSDGWTALNYVIDQGAAPMKTSAVTLRGSTFRYSIPALNGSYQGELSADGKSMVGTWTQGASMPLLFVRATKETAWDIPVPPAPLKPMAKNADPAFEVATLKPSLPDGSGKYLRVVGRRYMTHNTSLADLMEVVYGVHPRQITGGPAWVDNDKFDLLGVPDAEGEPDASQWLLMIKKMLAARFKLVFHHENRQMSAYVLSVAKNGPKNLKKSDSNSPLPTGLEFVPGPSGLLLPARNTAIGQFAQMMQQVVLDRPVVDRTGISGRFDFQLTFTPDESQFNGHPPSLPPQTNSSPGAFRGCAAATWVDVEFRESCGRCLGHRSRREAFTELGLAHFRTEDRRNCTVLATRRRLWNFAFSRVSLDYLSRKQGIRLVDAPIPARATAVSRRGSTPRRTPCTHLEKRLRRLCR